MKKFAIAFLSLFLLASCSTSSKTPSLEEQLANDYNFSTLNLELSDFEEKYQRSISSSFLILNCSNTENGVRIDATGSGFAYKKLTNHPLFGDSYYIISNNHVVSNAERVFVVTHTGQIAEASVVGIGRQNLDISVLRADGIKNVTVAPLYNNGDVRTMEYLTPGEEVYALGTPSSINLFGTITKGIVSSDKRVILNSYNDNLIHQSHAIQIDVAINPGNSGGPLFNSKGEVIGVNTFKLTKDVFGEDLTGINFALPIHDMIIGAEAIIRDGNFAPYSFGSSNTLVNVQDLTIHNRMAYDLDDSILDGVLIAKSNNVTLEEGTIIKEFNGKEIKDTYDLRRGLFEANSSIAKAVVMDNKGNTKKVNFKLI